MSTDIRATITAKLTTEIAAWEKWIADRADSGHTALVGQPWIVACDSGMALRITGNSAVPVATTPGLCGVSHLDRSSADKVAKLRGAPYHVVAAADIPAMRLADLRAMLAALG